MRLLRHLYKRLLPLAFRRWLRLVFGWRWFRGDFRSWADARAASSGYDSAVIVERVLSATLAVRSGRAAYERDGVCFPRPEPDSPLLAALLRVSAACGDGMRVLDFGGALGSVYWRHRPELNLLRGLVWDVVEQPSFVAAGQSCLSGSPLRFFPTVGDAEAAGGHDLLLCATALQYLEDPHSVLDDWVARQWRFLLFNNLPLHPDRPDRLTIQHVPPNIHPASYPVWFFNRERLLAHFSSRYTLQAEFASEAVWPVGRSMYPSTGLLFERNDLL